MLRSSSDHTGSWDLKLPQDLVVLQRIPKAEGQRWKGWKLKMGGMLTSLLEIMVHSLACFHAIPADFSLRQEHNKGQPEQDDPHSVWGDVESNINLGWPPQSASSTLG